MAPVTALFDSLASARDVGDVKDAREEFEVFGGASVSDAQSLHEFASRVRVTATASRTVALDAVVSRCTITHRPLRTSHC